MYREGYNILPGGQYPPLPSGAWKRGEQHLLHATAHSLHEEKGKFLLSIALAINIEHYEQWVCSSLKTTVLCKYRADF